MAHRNLNPPRPREDLLLVVPSRGRPQNIERMWGELKRTCQGNTTLLVGLDADDPDLERYPALESPYADLKGRYEIRHNLRSVVPWINALTVSRTDAYRFIGTVGDDNSFRTEGWDTRIMEALDDAPFAFGNDMYPRAPGSLCCHVFCQAQVIERLGYFGPPSIRHMYVDVAWYAWGIRTKINYLHDVIIEHLHFTRGLSPADDSYAYSQSLIPHDLERWHEYGRSGRLNEDIVKLGGEPFKPDELRCFNENLFIPARWPG